MSDFFVFIGYFLLFIMAVFFLVSYVRMVIGIFKPPPLPKEYVFHNSYEYDELDKYEKDYIEEERLGNF